MVSRPPPLASEVVADPGTRALIERLPDWEAGLPLSGHDSPAFAPNLLRLLADMGLRAGDHPRVDRALDQMLAHQDPEGRFTSFAPPRGADAPIWGSLLCDTHAIIEVLVRFGFGADPRVRAGLDRMAADLTVTDQGRAWPCRAEPATGFRGPGRRDRLLPHGHRRGAAHLRPAPRRPAARGRAGHRTRRAGRVDHARDRQAVHVRAWPGVQDRQVAPVLVPGGRPARRAGPLPGTLAGTRCRSRGPPSGGQSSPRA